MPPDASPIAPFIAQQGFLLLDGGLATELEKRGHELDHKLWSASLLLDNSAAIREVHRAYLAAGADCIITASYQASIGGFVAEGMSRDQAVAVIRKSVAVAIAARDQHLDESDSPSNLKPLVAASIGPYGAFLADGSEFRGDYDVDAAALRRFHEPRWQLLVDSPADLLAVETLPSFTEAQVIRELLDTTPSARAWISFSCKDDAHISDGTPLADCTQLFNDCEQVIAVGVNCTAPRFISSLIKQARKGAPSKAVVVYPNSGESYDVQARCWIDLPDGPGIENAAGEWFNIGAQLIGGCCRTTPEQISTMRSKLLAHGRE